MSLSSTIMYHDQLSNIRFAAYVRKSSESEDRQILSIPSQKQVLKEHAQKLGITITTWIEDAASALKINNRQGFNHLLNLITEGAIDGIICWHPNRISRNMIEGGQIIHHLQNHSLKAIVTLSSSYFPEENILPLTIEMGMANQYSLELSRNVKRGNKTKTLEGGWCSLAPCGYINDLATKTVVKDPERFPLVRRMFDLYLTGKFSLHQICHIANNEWNFTTYKHKNSGGKPLSSSSLQKIFTNYFYCGIVKNGSISAIGNHPHMVTPKEFEDVQRILQQKGHKGKTSYRFSLTGHIKCGECNSSITAEEKIKYRCSSCNKVRTAKLPHKCPKCNYAISKEIIYKRAIRYTYYRCTKKVAKPDGSKCTQKCIRDNQLEKQYADFLASIQLDSHIEQWAKDWLHLMNEAEHTTYKKEQNHLQKQITDREEKRKNLLNMRLNNEIDKDEYLQLKEKLDFELLQYQLLQKQGKAKIEGWITEAEKEIDLISGIVQKFNNGSISDKKDILSKTGSNCLLLDGKLTVHAHARHLVLKKIEALPKAKIEPQKNRSTSDLKGLSNRDSKLWLATFLEVRTIFSNLVMPQSLVV